MDWWDRLVYQRQTESTTPTLFLEMADMTKRTAMIMNPFRSFLNTLSYLLHRRLHFPKERQGEGLTMADGQTFTIFRQVRVDPAPGQPQNPQATLTVRFQVANMTARQNELFSLLPMPFFIGLPGFRSKLWTVNIQTGVSQGVYRWDTAEDAENYANSFAMRFMTRRSVPGSVSWQIIPNQVAEEESDSRPQSADGAAREHARTRER